MMKKVVYFIFLMGCTFSCKNEATSQMTVSSTTIEESENSSEMIFNFSLTDYPTVFLKEEGLEECHRPVDLSTDGHHACVHNRKSARQLHR